MTLRSGLTALLLGGTLLAGSPSRCPAQNDIEFGRTGISGTGWNATDSNYQKNKSADSKILLVLSEVQLVGQNNAFKGFDAGSFNSLLLFALNSTPFLDVFTSASVLSQPSKAPEVARLASVIQNLDGSGIWTGDLMRSDGKVVRLGPVVVADSGGSRLESLRTITEIVTRNLRETDGAKKPAAIRSVCVEALEKSDGQGAAEFRSLLVAALRRARVPIRETESANECGGDAKASPEDVSLFAEIRTAGAWSITPTLIWQRFDRIPLPIFRGNEEEYAREQADYARLLVSAVRSYLGDCPTSAFAQVAGVSSRSDAEKRDVAQLLLVRQECPYLAAAILERGMTEQSDTVIGVSRAYRQAREPHSAERLLSRALKEGSSRPELLASMHYELALASYEQYHFEEAMDNFRLALNGGSFPEIHTKYAQAAYLAGDNEVASDHVELALKRDEFDIQARVLAIHLALDRAAASDDTGANTAQFTEALNHAIIVIQTAPRGTSSIESIIKDIASRAFSARPMRKENVELTDKALNLLLASEAEDAEVLLMRGRARIWLAGEDESKRLEALQDLRRAADLAKQMPAADLAKKVELQVVDVELAEGYFLNAKFEDAARTAQRFLIEKRPPDSDTTSYEPVAYLIKFASEALAGRSVRADRGAEEFRKQIQGYYSWPRLAPGFPAQKKGTAIPLAEWSFASFDTYVCGLKHPARDAVLSASQLLQKKLDAERLPQECTAVN
ncbi:MAG: hypothetical protein QOI05_390 [Bradyrhizobium sp.]|jgi:tetratricopeptide (TPR) repeat protein|nr:hypothetical protein [Bradyrhizobium sp.]